MRLRRNFCNCELLAESARYSGSALRSAAAETSSEGHSPSRMVRSHEPKDAQTSRLLPTFAGGVEQLPQPDLGTIAPWPAALARPRRGNGGLVADGIAPDS